MTKSKIWGKTKKKVLRKSIAPPTIVEKPFNKPDILELDLDENPYLAKNLFGSEEENFDISEDEIQPMIDILTEQVNDKTTQIAFYKTRNKTLMKIIYNQNQMIAQLKTKIDELTQQLKELEVDS